MKSIARWLKKHVALFCVAHEITIAVCKENHIFYFAYLYLLLVFYALGREFLELGIIEYDPLQQLQQEKD